LGCFVHGPENVTVAEGLEEASSAGHLDYRRTYFGEDDVDSGAP